jgi:hypothetical protein
MLHRIACRFRCSSSHSALVPQPKLVSLNFTIQNPSLFDADGEKTWVWHCNGEMAPYDVDDDVFFLVMQCLQTVKSLRFQPLAQVCSVDFERVSSVSQIMNIHASMEFDGLGPRRCAFPMHSPFYFPICSWRWNSCVVFVLHCSSCSALFVALRTKRVAFHSNLTLATGGGSRLMPECFVHVLPGSILSSVKTMSVHLIIPPLVCHGFFLGHVGVQCCFG